MKNKKYISLPVELTEIGKFSFDDSLIPVDIKVMHNGLNLNHSTFEDESIHNAQETLKNKPILGYIKKTDGTDEGDFSGHDIELVANEDGVKVVQLQRPLGTIPETNNYSIQELDGKKYVVCRGYLWKEYLNSGYDVLQKNPNKSVSMEIMVDDYDINEDGSINIIEYRYLGISILGDNVSPAMVGAELSVVGNFSDSNAEFKQKTEELNKDLFAIRSAFEGGEKVEDVKNNEVEIEEFEDEIVEEVDPVVEVEAEIDEVDEEVEEIEEVEEVEAELSEGNVEEDIDYESKFNELQIKYDELVSKTEELESENKSLAEYKEERESETLETQKDSIINDYSLILDEDEISLINSQKSELNLSELESQLSKAFATKELEKAREKGSKVKEDLVFDNKNRDVKTKKNKFAL